MDDDYIPYHCIFPQKCSQLRVLPDKWKVRASEIVKSWKSDRGPYQGCCCGNDHEKLQDKTVKKFKKAGFLVELN